MAYGTADVFRRLAAGDEAAYQAVWSAYGERIAMIARRLLGPGLRRRLETDDIVQTVFATLFRVTPRPTFDSDAAFLSWIRKVAERKIIAFARYWRSARRRLDRETPLSGDEPDEASDTPTGQVRRKELSERLALALSALPPAERSVAVSRLCLELPWAAIARSHGISEAAAQMRFARARKRLRAVVERRP